MRAFTISAAGSMLRWHMFRIINNRPFVSLTRHPLTSFGRLAETSGANAGQVPGFIGTGCRRCLRGSEVNEISGLKARTIASRRKALNPFCILYNLCGMLLLSMAISLLYPAGLAMAQPPEAGSILEAIDANMSSDTRIFTSRMIIHGRRGSRTVTSKSWAEGEVRSFTEYLAPAREKGVKMLKLEDKLWMYSPSTERTIQISGHMLRQSVMGSDLSYEDMMEDKKLSVHYEAVVEGEEPVDGRPCRVLSLTAKTKDVAYHGVKLWVDRERLIPLKEELYAKTGKLLKKMDLKDVEKIEGRWFPKRLIFKDMLKSGGGTEFVIEEIAFDQLIPPYMFTKASLKR